MKEEIEELKKEVKEINQDSFAMEMLKDYKKQNKRQFIIIIILIMCWLLTGTYLVYLLNDIGVIEETQEISDIDTIENSSIANGDVYGENQTN